MNQLLKALVFWLLSLNGVVWTPAALAQTPAAPPPATAGQSPGGKAGPAQQPTPNLPVPDQPQPAVEPPAPAPPSMPALALPAMDDVLEPVAQALAKMQALEAQFERIKSSDGDLGHQRSEVDQLISQSDKNAEALRPRIEQAKVQIEKLGPGPKDDQPPEAPQIAAERTRLATITTTLEGAYKSTELVRVRASQLSTRIQDIRRGLFAQNLFLRSGSPLLPGMWRQIGADFDNAQRQMQAVFGTWQGIIRSKLPAAATVVTLAALAYAILWFLVSRILTRRMPSGTIPQPTYTARVAAAATAAPLYALPGTAAAAIIYYGAETADLIYSRVQVLTTDLFQVAIIVIVVSALARAILEPRRANWRLVNLSNKTARSLLRSALLIAAVYATDQILKEVIRLLYLPLPYSVALSFITSLAFASLLLKVVATRFVPAVTESEPIEAIAAAATPPAADLSIYSPRWLKVPLLGLAFAIVAAALAGYVALSRFAAGQVVITGSAVVLVTLFHLAIRTAEKAVASPDAALGGWLARSMGVDDGQRTLIARILSILLHVLLAIVAIPGLLLAWGFSSEDVLTGAKSAMFGFQIGQIKISLVRILIALSLFIGLLLATRLIQRWLQSEILRPERMDPGIANSIHQGIGYAGFSLAALAAISFGGIDITYLAILAGALSVGIGIGLQSIVNNFVSGLILLVERPIKVGDLIVLRGGGEGYVRSISVRSTEIETFDRSSLIVPNSELISNVVTNWTHRNALGRVVVKVNASYKSDPEHVLAVLAEVAKSAPLAMQQPPPLISLDNLGADALEFSIRVIVSDVNKSLAAQTQLRSAVHRAFQANGIEFPTAERDIYLRDLDGVKVLIARVLEERQRQQASQNPHPVGGKPAD